MDNVLYQVNPHDLTKWCSGLLRYCHEDEADTQKFILEIVYYEAINIFGDKLASEVEQHKLKDIVSNYLQKAWGYSGIEKSLNSIFYVPSSKFCNGKKGYVLVKSSKNDWSNSITKGMHIYGK